MISISDPFVNYTCMSGYLSIIILGLALFGLSIGVVCNNKPIQGSCGGVGADESCTICSGDPEKCEDLETA